MVTKVVFKCPKILKIGEEYNKECDFMVGIMKDKEKKTVGCDFGALKLNWGFKWVDKGVNVFSMVGIFMTFNVVYQLYFIIESHLFKNTLRLFNQIHGLTRLFYQPSLKNKREKNILKINKAKQYLSNF